MNRMGTPIIFVSLALAGMTAAGRFGVDHREGVASAAMSREQFETYAKAQVALRVGAVRNMLFGGGADVRWELAGLHGRALGHPEPSPTALGLRGHAFHQGAYHDQAMYGLLASE